MPVQSAAIDPSLDPPIASPIPPPERTRPGVQGSAAPGPGPLPFHAEDAIEVTVPEVASVRFRGSSVSLLAPDPLALVDELHAVFRIEENMADNRTLAREIGSAIERAGARWEPSGTPTVSAVVSIAMAVLHWQDRLGKELGAGRTS